MEFDPDISIYSAGHPEAVYTDGGRFLLQLDEYQVKKLFSLIKKLSKDVGKQNAIKEIQRWFFREINKGILDRPG